MVLDACGCPVADGVYDWDVSDILRKNVEGFIAHEDNEYINREGETIKTKQHKVVDIRPADQGPEEKKMNPEEKQRAIDNNEIAWDE